MMFRDHYGETVNVVLAMMMGLFMSLASIFVDGLALNFSTVFSNCGMITLNILIWSILLPYNDWSAAITRRFCKEGTLAYKLVANIHPGGGAVLPLVQRRPPRLAHHVRDLVLRRLCGGGGGQGLCQPLLQGLRQPSYIRNAREARLIRASRAFSCLNPWGSAPASRASGPSWPAAPPPMSRKTHCPAPVHTGHRWTALAWAKSCRGYPCSRRSA